MLDVFKNPKQPITKRFVQQVTEPEETKETIQHLLEHYPHGQVVKLTFIGEAAEHPLITNLIRNFDVAVNILQGKISQRKMDHMEHCLFILMGTTSEIQKAIELYSLTASRRGGDQ